MGKKIVTAKELAEELNLKPRTIRAWARQRKIPSLRISPKVVRFDLEAVIRVLSQNFRVSPAKRTVLDGKS